MIVPLLPRNTTDNNSVTTAPSPTPTTDGNQAQTPLAHLNLVGILVIASLVALAIILSLCFAKWSKPIRRFFRGEHSDTRRDRFGRIGHCLSLSKLSKASRPPPPSPLPPLTPQSHAADAEKAAVSIPDSSNSSKTSLDQDRTEIDKVKQRANVKVALPPKVRKDTGASSIPPNFFFQTIDTGCGAKFWHRFYTRLQSSLAANLRGSTNNLRETTRPSFRFINVINHTQLLPLPHSFVISPTSHHTSYPQLLEN
jgi:hypothetical protein